MPRAAYRRPRMIPDEVVDRKPHFGPRLGRLRVIFTSMCSGKEPCSITSR